MIRTFLDAGILIYGGRGKKAFSDEVLNLLDDADREFISSLFVKLEVLPKAVHFTQKAEADFYREYFSIVQAMPHNYDDIIVKAQWFAEKYGLGALDALHIATAVQAGVAEFITTEGLTKPLFRVTEIKVVRLQSLVEVQGN